MTEPSELSTDAKETVRRPRLARRRRFLAMVLCAIVLYWYGSALYQRLTWAWYWADNIQGFVAYGQHDNVFSPDASQVAVAFGDQCKVLDLTSGKESSRLEQCAGQGLADFSSDGKIMSRFSDDISSGEKAYLWNSADGRVLGSVKAPESASVEKCWPGFSPDGKIIVAACAGGLLVWDSLTLKCLGQVKVVWPKDVWLPKLLSWNPATQELTAIDAVGKLLKIDVRQHATEPLFAKQTKPVTAAGWSPDGTRLVTIDREDGSVAVRDAQAGKVTAGIPEKKVLYARFSPDGKQVLTAKNRTDVGRTGWRMPRFWDRRTQIWDSTSGKLIRELPTTGFVTFSPDWSFYVETGPKGLRISGSDGSESCYFPQWFDGHGSSCVFARDNSYLASVNGSGRVAIWRHHGSWIECLTGHELWMSIMALAGLVWAILVAFSRR